MTHLQIPATGPPTRDEIIQIVEEVRNVKSTQEDFAKTINDIIEKIKADNVITSNEVGKMKAETIVLSQKTESVNANLAALAQQTANRPEMRRDISESKIMQNLTVWSGGTSRDAWREW